MPGALTTVAYKRAIMAGYRPVKRMRMTAPGYKYGYMARVGYQGARWAVPRIQRWYRKRRNKKMRHKMYRRTDKTSAQRGKAHQNGIPGGANDTFGLGQLQISRNMPYPPQATAVSQMNLRKNNTIYMKGFKICRTFYVQRAGLGTLNNAAQVEIHWALVQMKMSGRADSFIKLNFFRDNTATTTRSRDFNDYGATDPWSAEFNCLPLNPGNDFNIITHQKRVLQPVSDVTNARTTWKIEKYYPLKKHVKFLEDDGQPEQQIIELYWANTVSSQDFPSNPTTPTVATWFSHTGYFSDKM